MKNHSLQKESGGAFAFNPGRRWECERELSQEIKCDYERKSKEREKLWRKPSVRQVYEEWEWKGSLWEATKSKAFSFHSESQKQWAQFSSNSPTICLQFLYSITMQLNCKGRLQWTFVWTVERAKATMADVRILNINSKQHKLPLIGCLTRFVFCSNKSSIFLS